MPLPQVAELVTLGAVSAAPAVLVVQAVKWRWARQLEAQIGKGRWDSALRVLAGLVGLLAGAILGLVGLASSAVGLAWGAGAGIAGGLLSTALYAAARRAIRAWRPTGTP